MIEFEDDEFENDDPHCPYCGYDGEDSHYHCGNCGDVTGMMGHYVPAQDGFTCETRNWENGL